MGKNKLARWTELGSYDNVIQPEISDISGKDHPVKGNWQNELFKNENPIVLELGCGKGEYTIGLANRFPDNNFIGIDIKGARLWRGAKTSNEQKLPNVAFLRTRIEFINSFFSENEVDEIWITFPDPHPGGRNSNKRLTSPRFLNSYRLFLKDKGLIHLKTDNTELYNFTKTVINYNILETVISTDDLYSHKIDNILSIRTHYEKIFLDAGLKINFLSFRLDKEKIIQNVSP
ncbi:MAG TPA: tRNA (guanosine(46)-N7)-methyltransferase TrmB [Bacteroidales bacterium]